MLREDQHDSDYLSTEQSTATDHSVASQSEEVHIRNFDVNQAYDLTIEVYDTEGVVFVNRYYLTPGKTVSELGRIPPGEYELRVELDGCREEVTTCEIDGTPEGTALVEIGNETVSVTQGLYR